MERSNLIPVYLEANNKELLVKLMLSNNMAHGCYFKYFDIQKDSKKWVAWYYAIVDLNDGIKVLMKE